MGDNMTKNQVERKIKHLRQEILYLSRVFPKSEKIKILKSIYKHYIKLLNSTKIK